MCSTARGMGPGGPGCCGFRFIYEGARLSPLLVDLAVRGVMTDAAPPVEAKGVDGVRGVAMYLPPHLRQRLGSSAEAEAAVGTEPDPPAAAPPLCPPRRGWYRYPGWRSLWRTFSSSASLFQNPFVSAGSARHCSPISFEMSGFASPGCSAATCAWCACRYKMNAAAAGKDLPLG